MYILGTFSPTWGIVRRGEGGMRSNATTVLGDPFLLKVSPLPKKLSAKNSNNVYQLNKYVELCSSDTVRPWQTLEDSRH